MINLRYVPLFLAVFTLTAFAEPFESTSSVDHTRTMIEKLPTNDIWWVPEGEEMHWNFRNLHRFMPTVNVYRSGRVSVLPNRINPEIGSYPVTTASGEMSFAQYLESGHSSTMGIVILHKGEIVFEAYPRQASFEKPIFWSVTKIFVSGIVAILEAEGRVDVAKPIDHYLPQLSMSSFKGISVRDILDMATGLDCPEEYEDKTSCYYRYSVTVGDGYFGDADDTSPYEFVSALKVPNYSTPGTSYSYSGINTFVLSWLVEDLTGMPFQDAVTHFYWQHIGAEHDASILAPRFGVPIAHGGMMATLRDMARFGLLHTPSFETVSKSKVFPDSYVHKLLTDGNPDLLKNARFPYPYPPDVSHAIYQWDLVFTNDDVYKGGWAGQGLLVNPTKDLVLVYTGFTKKNADGVIPLLMIARPLLESLYPTPKEPNNAE